MELPLFNRVSHRCPINSSLRQEVTAHTYVTSPQTICLMFPAMWQHFADYQQQRNKSRWPKQLFTCPSALLRSRFLALHRTFGNDYYPAQWVYAHIHTLGHRYTANDHLLYFSIIMIYGRKSWKGLYGLFIINYFRWKLYCC